jgi:hypothetical protein
MVTKNDFLEALKKIDTSKAETIYGLSDGHIYINPKPSFIQRIATESDLEIITIKGPEIKIEPQVEKIKESKSKADATTGS